MAGCHRHNHLVVSVLFFCYAKSNTGIETLQNIQKDHEILVRARQNLCMENSILCLRYFATQCHSCHEKRAPRGHVDSVCGRCMFVER